MAKKEYEFLDELGLQNLAKGILNQVNSRITERIATVVDENSDDFHVASAAAVYRAIAGSHHTSIKTITGDIDVLVPLEDRDPTVMYYQRDNEEDKTWMIYIWDVDNQQWINVGDTEVDLSNYWTKDDTDALREDLGIVVIEEDVANIKNDIININAELAEKVDKKDLGPIAEATVRAILDAAYEETDPFKYEEVRTLSGVTAALANAGTDPVAVRIVDDIDLTTGTTKSIAIPAGVDATILVDQGVKITAEDNAFTVADGASLTLNGRGTVEVTTKKTRGAITVEPGGELTIDGVTIDATVSGKSGNYAYGVYVKNTSTINFVSGCIKTAYGSAISTNNTTGGSTINISGGELYSDGSYAIYNAAQGTINITGGVVQGINARMGTINVSGDAQIIATTIDASSYDDIGSNFATSGCIWFGDTIALVSGSYSDPNGIGITLNVRDNAVIDSEFRAAIGIYTVDTKEAADVLINVENGANVTTSDVDYDAIRVYDHDYITAAATAAGKTYNATVDSTVQITVDGAVIYPVA